MIVLANVMRDEVKMQLYAIATNNGFGDTNNRISKSIVRKSIHTKASYEDRVWHAFAYDS